jgi:1-acyl-sn-glycerol-3-phosphate acyltransferase
VKLLKNNRNIFVFPEGHITDNGSLGKGRGGISYLSRETGTTIVPIGISGVYQMTRKEFFGRKRRIKVVFGPPILRSEIDNSINMENTKLENIYKAESEYVLYKIKQLL